MRSSHLCLSLLLIFAVTSCGLLKRKKATPPKETATGDISVGVVEMINPEQKFVLISLSPGYVVTSGTKLFTYSPSGLKAELKVTPERKFSFLAADILEGYPQKGKPVFASREALVASLSSPHAATDQNSSALPPPPDPTLNWGGTMDSATPSIASPHSTPSTTGASNATQELPPLNNPYLNQSTKDTSSSSP